MDTKNSTARHSVLLLQPNYAYFNPRDAVGVHPPLGLAYIAATLRNNGIPVEILDANVGNLSPEQAIREIQGKKPTIVGVTFIAPAHDYATEVARGLPRDILTIAGGPQASALTELVIREGFSAVIRGEGESPMLELATGKPLQSIAGVSYPDGTGAIVHNPNRDRIDPDLIPLPARDLLTNNGVNKPYWSGGTKYYPWSPILTSRGCPYGCNYCSRHVFGTGFRARSPENVLLEIDELVTRYSVRELNFYDDSFNFDVARAERIMDLLIERNYNLHLRFSNGIRADRISPSLLQKMRRAGTEYLAFGIESGDPEVLRKIRKNLKLEQVTEAVRMSRKAGIFTMGFFMLGLLGDTEASMKKTIRFAKSLGLDGAQFTIATPYPGTEMWDYVKENGHIEMNRWAELIPSKQRIFWSWPGMPAPDLLNGMYRKAFREFYFDPRYILRKTPSLLRPSNMGMAFNGLRRVISSIVKR